VPSFLECVDFIPIFSGDEGDTLAQHLIDFHQCIYRLNIYHEDALMKMFVYSLNGDARRWYPSLSIASISSLQEFHPAFHKYCKRYYSSDILFEKCCEKFTLCIHQRKDCALYDEHDQDQNVSLFSKVLEDVQEEKKEIVANSTLPIPFISDPIEQKYGGNIEVLQEQLILLLLPVVE
jgi:hypothetical protein